MRKVKRTYTKYFGVTRRRMRIKTGASWHTYLMIAALSFIGGVGLPYWELNGGSVIGFISKIEALEAVNQYKASYYNKKLRSSLNRFQVIRFQAIFLSFKKKIIS